MVENGGVQGEATTCGIHTASYILSNRVGEVL